MQLLTFTVAGQPYAIPSRQVLEVLPLVPARSIPLLPDYVAGVFTYRGHLVPLVDLARRFDVHRAAEPERRRLSTRVIVVEFTPPDRADGIPADPLPPAGIRLGLVADDVVSIQGTTAEEDTPARVTAGDAPFLGRLLRLGGHTVQLVVVEHVVPADLLRRLVASIPGGARS